MKKILLIHALVLIQFLAFAQTDMKVEVIDASFKKEAFINYSFDSSKPISCTDEIYILIRVAKSREPYTPGISFGTSLSCEYYLDGKSKGKLDLLNNSWKPELTHTGNKKLTKAFQDTTSENGSPASTRTKPWTIPFADAQDILVKAPFTPSSPGQKSKVNKYVFKLGNKIYNYSKKSFQSDPKSSNHTVSGTYIKKCNEDKKYVNAIAINTYYNSNEKAIASTLYPVPVTQGTKLTLDLNVVSSKVKIRVFNRSNGREVAPSVENAGFKKMCIETKSLRPGLYDLLLYGDKISKPQKITFRVN